MPWVKRVAKRGTYFTRLGNLANFETLLEFSSPLGGVVPLVCEWPIKYGAMGHTAGRRAVGRSWVCVWPSVGPGSEGKAGDADGLAIANRGPEIHRAGGIERLL